MAAGLWMQIVLLMAFMLAFVCLGALILILTGIHDSPPATSPSSDTANTLSPGEAVWKSLMHAMDTGTVGADEDWKFRAVMLLVTAAGVVVMAGLIGVFGNSIQESLTRTRQGRSQVKEEDYSLILGWSPAIFNVIRELIIANQKRSGAHKAKWRVVILADRDKVQMEDEIRAKLRKAGLQRHSKRVICRTGNPVDVDDLKIVRPRKAKSILILAPQGDEHDSQVIKTILAVQHTPQKDTNKGEDKPKNSPVTPYIVYGLHDAPRSRDVAALVEQEEAGLGKIYPVDTSEVIARIIAQTCRQAGMSEIYTKLLEYNKSQICLKKVDKASRLVGKTFKQALLMLPDVVLIGIQKGGKSSKPELNPMDKEKTIIEEGDKIIIIAESKTFATVSSCVSVEGDDIKKDWESKPKPEHTLILGWNARGHQVLNELNDYTKVSSQVTVVADVSDFDQAKWECVEFQELRVEFRKGDPTKRAVLNSLGIGGFDHIIVLGSHDLTPQQADMNTLATLLHLRHIKQELEEEPKATVNSSLSIVSEMLVDSNRKLAENTRDSSLSGHDFIVSYKLISSLMTQISQREELKAIFDELLEEEGMEIYLKPAENYVTLGTQVNFSTVIAAAIEHNECAIGYRILEDCHKSSNGYGVTLNPSKSETTNFSPGDRIIVIAKDEWDEPVENGGTLATSD